MNLKIIKNIGVIVAFVSTIIGVCVQPQLVKWMLGLYIINSIVLWLGDEK